jgi:hypothetical protein
MFSSSLRLCHSSFHSLSQQFSFKLSNSTENLKREPSCWQRRIDALAERHTRKQTFHQRNSIVRATLALSLACNHFQHERIRRC